MLKSCSYRQQRWIRDLFNEFTPLTTDWAVLHPIQPQGYLTCDVQILAIIHTQYDTDVASKPGVHTSQVFVYIFSQLYTSQAK